jgi:acetyl esterase/lipase
MKRHRSILLATSALAAAMLACLTARGQSSSVVRTEDVIYGRKFGMALTMDVFQPRISNHRGSLFLVNGGWLSSKSTPMMQNIQPDYYRPFLDHGYTVFAVVTSSQPAFTIPDIMADVLRATRFVRASATRFDVRPDRLGVTGASSGGQLALSIATMQAVACFFPPTDFLNYGGPGKDGVGLGPMKPLQVAFGPRALTAEGRQALGREISPIYFVTASLPPTLLIHGDADPDVPIQQSLSFVDRARAKGAKHIQLTVRPGKAHGWPKGSIVWKSDEDVLALIAWFDKFLAN